MVRGPHGEFKQLALVDYGQVKILSQEDRLAAARVLVAYARCDPSNPSHVTKIASLAKAMGLVTEKDDPDTVFKMGR